MMSPDEVKKFIKEIFVTLIEEREVSEATCARYFSKEYIQYVDGKVLDYDHFVKHMKTLMATIKSAKVTFKHIIVEGDKVATVHNVKAIKNDGSHIEAQVNALMQIKNNKIILCDELTHLIQGEKSDKDLGSRH
ncbi:MAG: nuclear transport factor 2 family protein [Pseudomonadota bacterium]